MAVDPKLLKYAESLFKHRLDEEIRREYRKRLSDAKTTDNVGNPSLFSGAAAKRIIDVEAWYAKEAARAQAESLIAATGKSGFLFDDEVFRRGTDDLRKLVARHAQNAKRIVAEIASRVSVPPGAKAGLEQMVDADMMHIHDSILGLLQVKRDESALLSKAPKEPSEPTVNDDRTFVRMAIEQARKSISENDGRPHPKVGAVVVKNGQVLSSAHRGEITGNHAEYVALEKKLPDDLVAGATLYTTLEPCTTRNHPKIPCAERIIQRKVARVVIGMLDPDSRISGRGQRKLRSANIVTDFFPHDLMTEVEELNREFTRHTEQSGQAVHTEATAVDAKIKVILSYQNKPVTVINRSTRGHFVSESYWPQETVVADCTSLWVTLEDKATKQRQSFPLNQVDVNFDNERNRLRIEIQR
jgi:pyrimidine deaminase RibD-like protein